MSEPGTITREHIEAVAKKIEREQRLTPEKAMKKAERWANKKSDPNPAPRPGSFAAYQAYFAGLSEEEKRRERAGSRIRGSLGAPL